MTVPEAPPTDDGPVEIEATRPRSPLLRDNLSVAAGTALSRVTGVLRFLALYAAVSPSLRDAYVLANNTPNIIYELILGGVLTATLVPLFTEQLVHDDTEATSAIVSTTLLALIGLTAIAVVTAPLLIVLYGTNPGPGVDAGQFRSVGISLALLFAPQVFFYGAMAVGSALLNARKRFFAAAWAPVLNNVVVIAVLLSVPRFFTGDRDLAGASAQTDLRLLLGLGTTAGIVAMAISLLPALRRAGIHIHFRPSFRHPAVRRAMVLSGWTIGYVVANQVAAQIVNVLAEPGSGDVTNYATAFMFFQLPHGLLAVSLMTTFQPDMARAAARHDRTEFNARLLLGLRLLGLVVVPAAIGYFALSRSFVDATSSSAWADGDVGGVAGILGAFGLGLIGFSVYLFVLRGFYALQDTRTPFLLNCAKNALNIALALALVGPFGVEGLAAAYAIAYTAAAILALAVLAHRHPGFGGRALLDTGVRTIAAAVVMGATVVLVMAVGADGSRTRTLASTGASVVVAIAVYGGVVYALGVPRSLGLARRRLRP